MNERSRRKRSIIRNRKRYGSIIADAKLQDEKPVSCIILRDPYLQWAVKYLTDTGLTIEE